jgi:hypothetical protein
MRTPDQIEASRRNGAKSRGPVTPDGKLRSSRGRITHGLLAKTVVLHGESAARFSSLLAGLMAEHQPRTTTEISLVESMAVNRWRQIRLWGMETAGINCELHRQSASPLHPEGGAEDPPRDPATLTVRAMAAMNNDDRSLETILRYEARFGRQYDRALHALQQLRLTRARLGEPVIPSPLMEK